MTAITPQVAELDMLNAAANQIVSIVAPEVSRLVRVSVILDEAADTTSTNGVRIRMPMQFCGARVMDDAPLSVGLLGHEVAHSFQPLREMDKAEKQNAIPHWLGNVVLDIHGETLIETVFPAMALPLTHVREIVKHKYRAKYQKDQRSADAAEALAATALLGRYNDPTLAFDASVARTQRQTQFTTLLSQAAGTPAAGLPALTARIIKAFPELRQIADPFAALGDGFGGGLDAPLADPRVKGDVLPALHSEARNIAGCLGNHTTDDHVQFTQFAIDPPDREAERVSRRVQTRFNRPQGAISVVAPGRLDRLELARGDAVPFRLEVPPGLDRPAPQVLVAVDESGSMRGDKSTTARRAGQAIILSVRAAGGDARGLLFDDFARAAKDYAPDALFTPVSHWRWGGTSFLWLTHAWRAFPGHQFILVTDGDGALPFALPYDRRRTSVVLIPPGDRIDLMLQIGERVLRLTRLDDLPLILGSLVPRAVIA